MARQHTSCTALATAALVQGSGPYSTMWLSPHRASLLFVSLFGEDCCELSKQYDSYRFPEYWDSEQQVVLLSPLPLSCPFVLPNM